jgi:predicted GNAT family N-acyltransferase
VITIQRIDTIHPLYDQECALREDALLRPLGLDMAWFRSAFPGVEDRLEHFIAVTPHPDGPRVIGCACLLPNTPSVGSGRLMQMAVNPQRQGEGVGRRLVVAVECRAFGELGIARLYCHAQLRASSFYERLGWVSEPDIFEEGGIPHIKMTITQPVDEESAL